MQENILKKLYDVFDRGREGDIVNFSRMICWTLKKSVEL